MTISRRAVLAGGSAFSVLSALPGARAAEQAVRYEFAGPLEGWEVVTGQWAVENMPGTRTGRALVQRATNNAFNVIVAPAGPYRDVEAEVRFKPLSGREDASGGIVFRFDQGRYYVIRANALEGNFRLYYYDRARHEMASRNIKAPALGQWHSMRISAEGERLRGWLNDQPLLDHKDKRFAGGRIGLWTKADSVTAFEDLAIRPAGA